MKLIKRNISKQGKNILECKFDAYISKALGFNPAKMIPARCTAIKKTKISPVQDWNFCSKVSKYKIKKLILDSFSNLN